MEEECRGRAGLQLRKRKAKSDGTAATKKRDRSSNYTQSTQAIHDRGSDTSHSSAFHSTAYPSPYAPSIPKISEARHMGEEETRAATQGLVEESAERSPNA
ncbi:hypothetical protein ANCCAN_26755 [Ancylostoma caninum]|uniref:Uncharacterized protein n=1 Tax=Ancylostoma caninum TaxID=29170 RepID=A0A368F5V2_ANCCA|nr:hypothetical protein ANCCAN_26755 [Ancylostoma caninum]